MLVTIITVTFNSAKTLADCLESVYMQSSPDIEHIIVDGASSDDTLNVIKNTPNRVTHIISEPDTGIYDAINKGIEVSNGEIIGLLHADDIFASENTLSTIIAKFNNNVIDGVYGDLLYVSQEDVSDVIRYWRSKRFDERLLRYGWMPAHPTLFLKKSIYEKYGTYNTKLKIASDYDFMLRIMLIKGHKIYYLAKVITKMRIGGASNKSMQNILRKSKEDYLAIKLNKIPNPILVLFLKNLSKIPQYFNTFSAHV